MKIQNKNRLDLKKEISRIFVKWNIPTRQVAINEILSLLEGEFGKWQVEESRDFLKELKTIRRKKYDLKVNPYEEK